MFVSEFPEGLLRLCLRDGVNKNRITQAQDGLFCEGIPVLVGQGCPNYRAGEIHDGANSSDEGDMFDTNGDGLADDVQCPLPGDLRTAGVSLSQKVNQGDDQPQGYP